jgi:hypothetical protein
LEEGTAFETIELSLACGQGHTGRFLITLADGAGWDLVAEFDDQSLATQHCRDWHRVERLMARIEAELCHTFAEDRRRCAERARDAAA